jgi:hypothetical protein
VSHIEPQSVTVPAVPDEGDPRRSSATSRRTCSSSPSSSFFPNASRSARDLTSLAARVHSPGQSDNPQHILGLDLVLSGSDRNKRNVESNGPDWQLPSLNFRPLSFAAYAQSSPDRPKSAEGVKSVSTTEIISPTPERPVSSQSRRRFSKILGIEDNHHSIASTISRPYNSMNFARLKRVAELPESTYPARFSIPPYSPRRSTIAEGTNEDDADGDGLGLQDTNSSQATSNAESTVESLLDKHIQCLGLQPDVSEVDPGPANGQKNKSGSLTASGTESTVKVSDHDKQHWYEKPRPRTVSSAYPSTLASPERELLVPKKLFSNKLYLTALSASSQLTSARSLPCMSSAASLDRTANRPSTGWHTLASTTQLLSPTTLSGFEANSSKNLQDQSPDTRKYKIRRRSRGPLSPSASSCRPQELDDIYDWDDDASLQKKKWRNECLARQASERRKVRVRLKLKRSSMGQSKLGDSENSNTKASSYTAPANIDVVEPVFEDDFRDVKQPVELPAYEAGAQALKGSDQGSDCELAAVHGQRTSGSPEIPYRWSSIVAIAPEVVGPSTDICRLTSIRTACSHRSHGSLAEPNNSTRLSAQIPRLSIQAPRLASPDLAPSLSSLNLDMSVRYPDMIASPRPVLRETRSFFSDDSSAIHKQRGSLRNRFNLHSLRSVLPSSPRRTMISDGVDTTPRSNVTEAHQPRQIRGNSGEEEERDLYGTVGMTDFAYRKRKIIERLKDWWKRHSMQRKLGLKRKKSSKNIANGEVGHGIEGVVI